jgi:flagellar hook assembly protein FlgD
MWDGKTDKGEIAEAGTYTLHIEGEENDSSLYAFIEDVVTGVRFTDNNAMLKIHGMELPLGYILDVASGSQTGGGEALSQGSAVALLGKNVRVQQSTVAFSQGENQSIGIKVNAAPDSMVQVNICNGSGDAIRTLSGRAGEDGVAFLTWNGELDEGGIAQVGEYAVEVTGSAANPSLYAFVEGKVDGVSTLPGGTMVRIGGVSFSVNAIIDISETSST